MFKKVVPTKRAGPYIRQYPHCDARILHAPGECEFCDHHGDWQDLRLAWGIAFTGYEPEGTELPDPATHARPATTINRWPGNKPRSNPPVNLTGGSLLQPSEWFFCEHANEVPSGACPCKPECPCRTTHCAGKGTK